MKKKKKKKKDPLSSKVLFPFKHRNALKKTHNPQENWKLSQLHTSDANLRVRSTKFILTFYYFRYARRCEGLRQSFARTRKGSSRRSFKCASLHHQTLERGNNSKEYKVAPIWRYDVKWYSTSSLQKRNLNIFLKIISPVKRLF